MPDRFEYRRGATYVGSTISDLLDAGAGVCQDFVHLSLVLLRRQGIAARYVSGYLWAAPAGRRRWTRSRSTRTPGSRRCCRAPTARGEPVWVGADPTNRAARRPRRHVKIGHGRFYADVPPVKGVFRGPAGVRTWTRA